MESIWKKFLAEVPEKSENSEKVTGDWFEGISEETSLYESLEIHLKKIPGQIS